MIFDNNLLFNLLRILRNKYFRIRFRSEHIKLARMKKNQRKKFDGLKRYFYERYNRLSIYNIDRFMTPLWKEFNSKVEKTFLPYPSFHFLNDPTIMVSMFATAGGDWMKKELNFLKERIDEQKLKRVLEEDYVGEPLILDHSYLTSHTVIHHFYHLVKFLTATKTKVESVNTIVEWGGGYGSLIRILKKFKISPTTYIVIDTPLFSCLQWLYLSTIYGGKEVNLIVSENDKIIDKKINLLPICFLKDFKLKADMFISTWALSESSKYSQDYVLEKNWFDADHILLAYQDNPSGLFDPARVGKLAVKKGAFIEDMEHLPGNHYAFK